MKKLILISVCLIATGNLFPQNPGNVGTVNLSAWFKPDLLPLGNVGSWTTTYPTGASGVTVTDNLTPFPQATNTPLNGISNYNTTIEFASNTITNLKALQNTSSLNLLDNSTSSSQGSFFGVYYLPSTTSNDHMMLYNEVGNDGIQFRNLGANGRFAIGKGLGTSVNASNDWAENLLPTIVSYKGNRSTSATMKTYENSYNFNGGGASQSSGATGLYFGVRPGNTTSPLNGFLHEFIFYNRTLSVLEMNKIHTYLAVKYGITLDNLGGGIQGDYIATGGAVIWDASLFGNYHNNVIGIGREDNESLLQKQSHTFDDVTRIYINNLSLTNVSNSGTIVNDTSYVLIGNDNGVMCPTAVSNLEVPPTPLVSARLEREWKITKTNFSQNFSCDFTIGSCVTPSNFNLNCLVLLVDDDGNFTNSTVYNSTSGIGFSVSGNVITVSGITSSIIPDNGTKYITIGSVILDKNLGNDTVICNEDSLLLDAGNLGATYLWQDASTNKTLVARTTGTYWVKTSSNGCELIDTINIIFQKIIPLFGNDTTICEGDSLFLDAGNLGATYLWQDASTNKTLTAKTTGVYWVKTSLNGCELIDSIVINVLKIIPFFGNDTIICKEDSLLLDAGNIGATYLWQDASTNKILTAKAAGTYWVKVLLNGCELIDTLNISKQNIKAAFSGINLSGCVPVSPSFTDQTVVSSGTIVGWNWDFGDGNISSLQNPSTTYTNAGTFNVKLSVVSNLGCKDSAIINSYVSVFGYAKAEFIFTPSFGKPQDVVFFTNLSTNSTSWVWYFGDGDSSIIQSPSHVYINKGTYIITLIASNINGCNDTISYQIKVKDELFFAPNTFTPNNDGENDIWQIVGLNEVRSFELFIFNRWGETVYESGDIKESWDGKHNGVLVQTGEYIWKIKISYDGQNSKDYFGHINLIR